MPVRVKCPNCKKEIKAPDKYRGKKISCPGCKEHLHVPAAESDVAPAKEGDFPPLHVSVETLPSGKPNDRVDEPPARPPARPAMQPEPLPEIQEVAYAEKSRPRNTERQDVRIVGIRMPLYDIVMLIIMFWVATIAIAAVLAITWLVFLMFIASAG